MYLAEHTLLGRRAAIKVLLPELSAQRHSVDRFFNEARAATTVSDPGIVQVFDFGYEGDIAYIVMEFLDGEALSSRLKRIGALDPSMALRIGRQIAGSLGAIHAAGLVHRDLKPDNVFMTRDPEAQSGERPKILDFGIAKLGDNSPNRIVTRTGQVMGTPVYMSPEQCSGDPVDHRADVYSLGCVIYQMLVGRPPFKGGIIEVISAHLRDPAPAPSAMVARLPGSVDELVRRCLAKSRDERFASMAELQRACDAAVAVVAATPSPLVDPAVASGATVPPTLASDMPTPPPPSTPRPTPVPTPTVAGREDRDDQRRAVRAARAPPHRLVGRRYRGRGRGHRRGGGDRERRRHEQPAHAPDGGAGRRAGARRAAGRPAASPGAAHAGARTAGTAATVPGDRDAASSERGGAAGRHRAQAAARAQTPRSQAVPPHQARYLAL